MKQSLLSNLVNDSEEDQLVFRPMPVGRTITTELDLRSRSPLPTLSTLKMSVLVVVYLVAGGSLPFFNKVFLAGLPSAGWSGFDYPLTTTTVQLCGLALVLTVYECVAHWCWLPAEASWAFGRRHWRRKLRLLSGPGVLFALVISLSNLGVVRPPLTVHLLLRSSELWWTMVAALALRRELPTCVSLACCVAVATGAALISAQYAGSHASHHRGGGGLVTWDLLFNLGSALFSGLLVALLRDACVRLRDRDPSSRVLEATLIKTVFAAVLVGVASAVFERPGWRALATGGPAVAGFLCGGVLLTLTYQALVVALATFSYALTVALLAQCKIVPQIPVAYWVFRRPFDPHPLHFVGLALVLVGAVSYALERYRRQRKLNR